jgi:hypothetical protein
MTTRVFVLMARHRAPALPTAGLVDRVRRASFVWWGRAVQGMFVSWLRISVLMAWCLGSCLVDGLRGGRRLGFR